MDDKSVNEVDMTSLSLEQTLVGMGDMVRSLLSSSRVVLMVQRDDGALTFINPLVVQHIPPKYLAEVLLETWDEAQVEEFLEHVYG